MARRTFIPPRHEERRSCNVLQHVHSSKRCRMEYVCRSPDHYHHHSITFPQSNNVSKGGRGRQASKSITQSSPKSPQDLAVPRVHIRRYVPQRDQQHLSRSVRVQPLLHPHAGGWHGGERSGASSGTTFLQLLLCLVSSARVQARRVAEHRTQYIETILPCTTTPRYCMETY